MDASNDKLEIDVKELNRLCELTLRNSTFGSVKNPPEFVKELVEKWKRECSSPNKPRNCDVFRTREAADVAYDKYSKWNLNEHFRNNDFSSSCLDYEDWVFAEYEPRFYGG